MDNRYYVSRVSYKYSVTDSRGEVHEVRGEHILHNDFVIIGTDSFFRPISVRKIG